MQTIFLKDGTQANLITKTDKGYVVDPLEIYTDYETKEEYTEPSGNVMMVDKVYDAAPLPVIQEEYKEILSKVEAQEKVLEEKRQELRKVEYDINRIKNTKTDVSRYIINREELRNAERLIVWPEGHILPRVLGGGKSHKFTVSYEISQYQSEERCWVYQLWSESKDSNWSGSEYFDAEYGIKVNLTDEEIKSVSLDRLSKKKANYFREHLIMQCPDEWLTPDYIQRKKEMNDRSERSELHKAQEELKKAQEKYDRLTQKELTVS
jgi:exosome complex RNA-binding protein Csl4